MCTMLDKIYIYICVCVCVCVCVYFNRKSLERVQLEFEIRIQFCVMCLNLCEDHTIIIHLSLRHVSI